MFRCEACGEIQEKTAYEPDCEDGGFIRICRSCGSSSVFKSREVCCLCRKQLFMGDTAYRAENRLYCTDCIKETEI